MKILHVLNVPFALPNILGDQIDYFNNLGSQVHIACSSGTQLQIFRKKWNFRYLELKVNRKFSFIDDLYSVLILYKYIKKHNINVVVGHTPKGAIISMLASFFYRVKKRIYFRHGLMFETSKGFKRTVLIFIEQLTSMLSTKVVCVSQSVFDNSIKYNLSKRNKLLLIDKGSCNGIDSINRFNKEKCSAELIQNKKQQLNILENDIVVGFVGRLAQDKGINELIEAWDIVKKRNNNVKLLLCGPIDERDPINDDVFLKITHDSTIIHTGEVFDTEYFYSIFSIFILPSYREGFPTVVLEASSMMLPVITTRSTGCVDSIIENNTGIFTDIDSHSISNMIQFYINNFNLAELHGYNGRQYVINNFNQKVKWSKLAALYLRD